MASRGTERRVAQGYQVPSYCNMIYRSVSSTCSQLEVAGGEMTSAVLKTSSL